MTNKTIITAALSASVAISSAAHAQWTVTTLHPAGTIESQAFGVSAGQQAGTLYLDMPGIHPRAVSWSGTAASWVDLTPPVAYASWAYGIADGVQVGSVFCLGNHHASLWNGTALSWFDLHPGGGASEAYGVHDGQQVGYVLGFDGVARASLWSSTPQSWVSLHPAGPTHSSARGIHAGQQVGSTTTNGISHAALWTGTASSWVDLHPAGADASEARSVHDGQQVGFTVINKGGITRAALWTGTASSWVDLTPAGATSSVAIGVHAGYQVGVVSFAGGASRASLWRSTALSWEDLSLVVPGSLGYDYTEAYAVWSDATTLYVVGAGWSPVTGYEALLWERPILPCPADISSNGVVNVEDLLTVIGAWGAHVPARARRTVPQTFTKIAL